MRKSGDFMLTRLWIHARRAIAIAMAAVMFAVSGPLSLSHAAMVSTDQVIGEESAVSDRERVMDFMAREDVRREFEAHGVDPDAALAR